MAWVISILVALVILLGFKLMEVLGALGRLQMMIDTTPMIWTTKGNKFQGEVEYLIDWFESEEELTFVEEYRFEGEVVRRNAHVRSKKGVEALSLVAPDAQA
ncbi:hypothetical protein UFOVP26_91 [uncultured Caudovirales phage]|uniref:Uncharacterized protein n=1 Tax=uncultured Caudovirales phage TaxID=2100421 RepID=A0A6J7WPR8_9CAUD|nr:hypothetical protein UFOVP26_91 [uncultured Caudovirales phage]CAB4123566.1 hypothetical protein UFOVP44_6 [uncultured Caudovirales phage]CAB5219747.1 hypothetical protein UFOVP220_135 [uncultured Caudovirales phage]